MTKKKHTPPKSAQKSVSKPAPRSAPAKKNRTVMLVLAGVGVLAVVAFASLSGKGGTASSTSAAAAPAEEQKYIGRLLPAAYQEPKVADIVVYTDTVAMTNVTAKDEGAKLSVAVGDVTANKIVKFEYAKAGGRPLPLMAYVKPSGKLFVAVSFCPPCEGEGQRIEAPGTLVCESCGTKRDLEQGIGISGACKLYPLDELPVTVVGDRINIDKSVLDSWTAQPKDRQIG